MQATNARPHNGRTPADCDVVTRVAHEHAVQFYESDAYLVELLADFAAEALEREQPVVIIATGDHAAACARALATRGIDIRPVCAGGLLTFLDAREMLSSFMDGELPNEDRFRDAIAHIFTRSTADGRSARVRVYGEMVDLLWRDGKAAATVRVEELWNELAATFNFELLCAYQLGGFDDATHTAALERICRAHTSVRPTERFTQRDPEERLVEIALLQQRARALETELRHRERLEAELRESVAAAERSRNAAEQANRAKSQFLAVMSHELRTPLNAIGGFAELLDMGIHGDVTADQRDALDRILRSQRHLLGLINQVLNYAKLETGSLRYDIVDVPVADAMRVVESLVFPQISAKGLHYAFEIDGGPWIVRADREKLQQIMLSLIINATKFTDAGGKVCIDCVANEYTVFLRVRDSGIGIPAEKVAAIFEPFTQVDTNYTRTRDGIGLGLAISRELARAMNGDLTVESAIGTGSVFTLALPRAAA